MEEKVLDYQKDIYSLLNSIEFDIGYIYETQRTLDEIKARCNDVLHDLRPYSFVEWVNVNYHKFIQEIGQNPDDVHIVSILKHLRIKKYQYTEDSLILGNSQKEQITLESRINNCIVIISSTIEEYIDIIEQELLVGGIDNYNQSRTNIYYILITNILSRMSNINDGDFYLKLLQN